MSVNGGSATILTADATHVAFSVSGLGDDSGTVTFTDANNKTVQVNCHRGGRTNYTRPDLELRSLDGAINSLLSVSDPAGQINFSASRQHG